jgi:hypothetical protein
MDGSLLGVGLGAGVADGVFEQAHPHNRRHIK